MSTITTPTQLADSLDQVSVQDNMPVRSYHTRRFRALFEAIVLHQRPHATEPGRFTSVRRQASKSLAWSSKTALEARLQSLPSELQDAFLLLVLESSLATGVVNVSKSYRPPWQRNVNSYSRRMLSEIYYGDDTIFCHTLVEDTSMPGKPDLRYFNRWLTSLAEDRLSKIVDIRLSMPFPAMIDRTRNIRNRVTANSPRSLWELENHHMHQAPGLHPSRGPSRAYASGYLQVTMD